MKTMYQFLQVSSWKTLALLLTVVSAGVAQSAGILIESINSTALFSLLCIGIGLFSIVTGYIGAGHSNYEMVPMTRQVVGGLVNGVLLTLMLYAGFDLFTYAGTHAISLILLIAVSLLFVEFSAVRISQNKKVTIQQLVGLVVAIGAVAYIGNSLTPEVQLSMLVFMVAGLVLEVVSRVTRTYLLSPWVSSFWNGWSILLVGLVVIPLLLSANIVSVLMDVAMLPLWLGGAVVLIGLSVMLIRFLKHKFRIARGYMQYKLQALTILFAAVSFVMVSDVVLLLAFGLIGAAYAIAEGRVTVTG